MATSTQLVWLPPASKAETSRLPGWSPPDSVCRGWSPPDSVCRGGAQNPGPDSMKRPAHTCAISLLAIPKTWSQDWRFHPSQISLKSPGSRSQNRPYKQRRKVKSHFPPY
ncbi:unnamed protein product, partial [Staurois parvus]